MRRTRRLKFQPGVEFCGNTATAKERTQEPSVTLQSELYNFGGERERERDCDLKSEERRGAEPVV